MDERRKYKRLPIELEIEVDKLFRQDNEIIEGFNKSIEVVNISKTGIGFLCAQEFPLEYYFNAKIEFSEKQFFYCVIKIIRKEKVGEGFFFGCEFVGLAEFLSKKVDEYELLIEGQEH